MFFINTEVDLLAILNSKAIWFWLFGEASPLRGGQWRLELREQYVSRAPLPDTSRQLEAALSDRGHICANAAHRRFAIQADVRHRILDLAGPEQRKLNIALENWHQLDFSEFRIEVRKALRRDIPVRQRSDWEQYLSDAAARVGGFTAEIEVAELEIDQLVYQGFDRTPREVSLLEASLVGQY